MSGYVIAQINLKNKEGYKEYVEKVPKLIKDLSNTWLFNFIGLFSIAFTASKDIETALISTIVYMLLIFGLNKYDEFNSSETGNTST